MSNFKVHLIDVHNKMQNYIWVIENTSNQHAVVIDPTEAAPVLELVQQHQLHIQQIWITHWHKDHTFGVPELLQHTSVPVYGPDAEKEKIPVLSHFLHDHDQLTFDGLTVEVIATPGHTLGHISYFVPAIEAAFVGDTLFAMGCGRVFEGTHEQMFHSLQRLAKLPKETQLYCGHEYTLANAQFSLIIEPDNTALQARTAEVEQLRAQQLPTLPTQLAIELETNLFLRAQTAEEFSKIRTLKDQS